jgi:hypothetical protein
VANRQIKHRLQLHQRIEAELNGLVAASGRTEQPHIVSQLKAVRRAWADYVQGEAERKQREAALLHEVDRIDRMAAHVTLETERLRRLKDEAMAAVRRLEPEILPSMNEFASESFVQNDDLLHLNKDLWHVRDTLLRTRGHLDINEVGNGNDLRLTELLGSMKQRPPVPHYDQPWADLLQHQWLHSQQPQLTPSQYAGRFQAWTQQQQLYDNPHPHRTRPHHNDNNYNLRQHNQPYNSEAQYQYQPEGPDSQHGPPYDYGHDQRGFQDRGAYHHQDSPPPLSGRVAAHRSRHGQKSSVVRRPSAGHHSNYVQNEESGKHHLQGNKQRYWPERQQQSRQRAASLSDQDFSAAVDNDNDDEEVEDDIEEDNTSNDAGDISSGDLSGSLTGGEEPLRQQKGDKKKMEAELTMKKNRRKQPVNWGQCDGNEGKRVERVKNDKGIVEREDDKGTKEEVKKKAKKEVVTKKEEVKKEEAKEEEAKKEEVRKETRKEDRTKKEEKKEEEEEDEEEKMTKKEEEKEDSDESQEQGEPVLSEPDHHYIIGKKYFFAYSHRLG